MCHFRKDLIHERIESAVSHLQSVVELGRVVRDRKTLPIKVLRSLQAGVYSRVVSLEE